MICNYRIWLWMMLLLGLMFGCQPPLPDSVQEAYTSLPEAVDFNLHVKPILSDKCFACHGPDAARREAGLRLDLPDAAMGELPETPGKHAIKAGNLAKSELFHRMLSLDPDIVMPPPSFKVELSDYEKAVLTKWIEDGAEYKPHWAFIPPEDPKIPKPIQKDRIKNPIDNFVQAGLARKGWEASPEAGKALLLRRVSLDLTGLPPTPEEVAAFMADETPDAYEKQVERLLASVHYGEKMATDWMDLARYADTYGYQVDRYRDMSPWRDWVIQAFNENMPYDQFVQWQMAGDLMPEASREQILATGFNRLHPQNMEGGIVDEEYRVEYVADRVAVLGDGLMGLTLSCAKCHDHKYDPISQQDYYQLYSFFNNINETGQISWDSSTPVPNLSIPTDRQAAVLDSLQQETQKALLTVKEVSEGEKTEIAQWIEQAGYQRKAVFPNNDARVAHYKLEQEPIRNSLAPRQVANMDREFSPKEIPHFTEGYNGKGLLLDGDAWLDVKEVGVFKRNEPFTIALWVHIPDSLDEGVIFHKNKGARLHCYRGYHLYYRDNKLEWMMARTWPENAIIEHSIAEIPRNEWVHLAVTYDGSSSAAGTHLFVNGEEIETRVEKDNLYKDIIYFSLEDVIYKNPIEPNLQIGARWRGKGLKGGKVDDIIVFERSLEKLEVLNLAAPEQLAKIRQKSPDQLTAAEKSLWERYYLSSSSRPYTEALNTLHQTRKSYVDSAEEVQDVMVLQEMDTARHAFILERGVYDNYGDTVRPATPESVLPMPEGLARNRLGLAQWLFLPEHPLTARVAVNRYWQMYFGRGLVRTTQDFGNQGELPTHPALLDWLALQFQASGWDVKALQRLIVNSATYRQRSLGTPEMLELDKENVWLARGPQGRLSSEMLRDNALAASGLLNTEVGGESVYPYQPGGLWVMNGGRYVQGEGDDLYRRSFYTIWKRTVPNPTLATFDQPDRNICTVRRQQTNTPLQALVLLNDPTYTEAAKVLGEQISRHDDPARGITEAYVRLTGKQPEPTELALLLDLQQKELATFQGQRGKAKGWLEAGAYAIDPELDPNVVASNAVVASVMLNSDATITKR